MVSKHMSSSAGQVLGNKSQVEALAWGSAGQGHGCVYIADRTKSIKVIATE